jgi:hypothetical protein
MLVGKGAVTQYPDPFGCQHWCMMMETITVPNTGIYTKDYYIVPTAVMGDAASKALYEL